MQDDPFDFAGMLCARLCHDLVGPVGALGNGLELLALDQDPAMRQQTLALMASSVGAVAAKLQFFRLAFGTGGDMAQRLPITALQTAINDFYALRPHIQIKWVTEGGICRIPWPGFWQSLQCWPAMRCCVAAILILPLITRDQPAKLWYAPLANASLSMPNIVWLWRAALHLISIRALCLRSWPRGWPIGSV